MLGPPSLVQDVRDPPLGCLTVMVELTSTPDLRSQSDHCIESSPHSSSNLSTERADREAINVRTAHSRKPTGDNAWISSWAYTPVVGAPYKLCMFRSATLGIPNLKGPSHRVGRHSHVWFVDRRMVYGLSGTPGSIFETPGHEGNVGESGCSIARLNRWFQR